MKQITIIFAVVALAFSQMGGCATTWQAVTTGFNLSASGQTGVVNDDKIVVNTEKALSIALGTFDVFLRLEYENRAALSAVPGVHSFAENVRRNGKRWIKSAEAAKNAYKHNRTELNHANLVTAYKTLKSAIEESHKYIEAHSGV